MLSNNRAMATWSYSTLNEAIVTKKLLFKYTQSTSGPHSESGNNLIRCLTDIFSTEEEWAAGLCHI